MGWVHAALARELSKIALLLFFCFVLGCSRQMPATFEPRVDAGGVKLTGIFQDSPASRAGLRENDLLTHLNGIAVPNISELRDLLKVTRPQETIDLKILRRENGYSAEKELSLLLADWPKPLPDLLPSAPKAAQSERPLSENWCESEPAHFERRSLKLRRGLQVSFYVYCDREKKPALSGAILRRSSGRKMPSTSQEPGLTTACLEEKGHGGWLGARFCNAALWEVTQASERFEGSWKQEGAPSNLATPSVPDTPAVFTEREGRGRTIAIAPGMLVFRDDDGDVELVAPIAPPLEQAENLSFWQNAAAQILRMQRR